MRTLADHLLASRTPEELARELAKLAKENCTLIDRIGALEHELFWRDVKEHAEISHLKQQIASLQANLADLDNRLLEAGEALDIALNGD